jgi:predicted PurR-regulated permease PerM
MTDSQTPSSDDRVVAAETRSEFVTTGEQTIGAVTEKKTFAAAAEDDEDMPLPTDPKTIFLGGLFFFAVMAVLNIASEIVLPLVFAIVLKLLLQPLVRFLEGIHIPRPIGALLTVLLVLLAFSGMISMLAGPATTWAGKLPEAIPRLHDSFNVLKRPIDTIQDMMRQLDGLTGGQSASTAPAPAPAVKSITLVRSVFSSTAAATSGLLTTLLVLFYLLSSGETFLRRLVEILPRFKDKRHAVELSADIEHNVSAYLLTITCINALVGCATGCMMWLCGVANPVLWGAVAFMLNFVPILGPVVGMAIFLMAGILSLGVTWWAVMPVGLYLCIHIIEGEITTPMVLARRFTINPVAVILALIFWYWMWGIAGAILAVPMLAITKIICDDLRPLRAIGHLLEG